MRKTVEVKAVVDNANRMLAHSMPDMTLQRRGIIALLERVLHDTGNYHGFAYLPPNADTTVREALDDGTQDETRRRYS